MPLRRIGDVPENKPQSWSHNETSINILESEKP